MNADHPVARQDGCEGDQHGQTRSVCAGYTPVEMPPRKSFPLPIISWESFAETPRGVGIIGAMPAYVISEVEMLDESQGQRYRKLAAASIARHGGRYIVRGAQPEVPEGDWPTAQRVVVVEFPTMDRLRGWYASTDYAEALAVRQTALTRRLLFVRGVDAEAT